MKKLLFTIIILIGLIGNAQEKMCDSIMKQMDFEIENAKENKLDANIIQALEQSKKAFYDQYCKDNVFYNHGGASNGNNNNNNDTNNSNISITEINNEYVKTKPYKGEPFYGKHKITVNVSSTDAEGTVNTNYSYYINKEGSLILLDKECLQNAGMDMIPDTEGGTFEYWAIRNDGISTVFALSNTGEKMAVTTHIKNFLISPQNNTKPTIKNLNKSKMIAGNLCKAYEVIFKELDAPKMTLWITVKPMLLQHDILPFTTMFTADKFGLTNFKNHGVLEIDMKHNNEATFLSVTEIIPSNKAVSFNGYTEFFIEY